MATDAVTEKDAPTPAQIAAWFPDVDPGLKPTGSRIVVQVKRPKKVSRGGIIIAEDPYGAEQDNTQIAIVRAVGPLAYRKRDDLTEWPEGLWCKAGDIVRIPRWGQHEGYTLKDADGEDVQFRVFDDFQIIGLVIGNPDRFRAYL